MSASLGSILGGVEGGGANGVGGAKGGDGIHGIDHMETGALDKDPVPSFDELYYDFCETVHGLDENVGRVLNRLDKLKLTDDTLVIYLGDNGFALGEHGFYDKRDAFEESIRIPLLVRAPGITRPGSRVENMVLNVDLAPTILDLAGVPLPKKPLTTKHGIGLSLIDLPLTWMHQNLE